MQAKAPSNTPLWVLRLSCRRGQLWSVIPVSHLDINALRPTSTKNFKPNTRFLQNIIRETTSHNAALKAKEAEEARAKLSGVRSIGGSQRGPRGERRGDRDMERRRREVEGNHDEGNSRYKRERRREKRQKSEEDDNAVQAARSGHFSEDDRRVNIDHYSPVHQRTQEGRRSRREHEEDERLTRTAQIDRYDRDGDRSVLIDHYLPENRREKHSSDRHSRRTRREDPTELEDDASDRSRHKRKRRDRHRHHDSRSHSRDRNRDRDRDRDRESRRSRSPHQKTSHKDRSERSPRQQQQTPISNSQKNDTPKKRTQQLRSTHHGSEQPEKRKGATVHISRRSPESPISDQNDDSDPLEALIGPALPPSPPKIRHRGRGARAAQSGIDSRFSAGYDPTTDMQPNPSDDDDWGLALEAMKDRARWKQQGADRLRSAGYTEDQISTWEKGGQNREENVKWAKKGEGREWDRGKVVDEDGVHTEVEWGRLKGT